MKTKSIIFLAIGIVLVLLNVLTDIIVVQKRTEELAYNIGTFIGSHLFGIVGIVFIVIAINQVKKENKRKQLISDSEIENIGKE